MNHASSTSMAHGHLKSAESPIALSSSRIFVGNHELEVNDSVGSLVLILPDINFPGNWPSKVSRLSNLPGNVARDWNPSNPEVKATLVENSNGFFLLTVTDLQKGSYEYKATRGFSWDKNYGQGGVRNGPNLKFTVDNDNMIVHFLFDTNTNEASTFIRNRPSPDKIHTEPLVPATFSAQAAEALDTDRDVGLARGIIIPNPLLMPPISATPTDRLGRLVPKDCKIAMEPVPAVKEIPKDVASAIDLPSRQRTLKHERSLSYHTDTCAAGCCCETDAITCCSARRRSHRNRNLGGRGIVDSWESSPSGPGSRHVREEPARRFKFSSPTSWTRLNTSSATSDTESK